MIIEKKTKVGVPPAVRDRAIVRCLDKSFGPNKNGNPMITTEWELVGFPQPDGSIATTVKRGGIDYAVGGLRCQNLYYTLTPKAIGFYIDMWEKAHPGESFPSELDETNPDIDWFNGLVMQVMIETKSEPQRKILTEEEKAELKAAGKEIIGEPITDEDGNPITRESVRIIQFLKPFAGELPPSE